MTTVSVLHNQLTTAGIPIEGVADNGDGTYRVDYMTAATPAQKTQAAGIVAAFNATAEQATLAAAAAEQAGAQPTAKTWWSGQQAAIDFIRLTPAQQATQIDAMTLAQLKVVVKYLAIAVSMIVKERLL